MSTGPERPLVAALRHELNALRGHWFWFVPLGIARVVLGPIALARISHPLYGIGLTFLL